MNTASEVHPDPGLSPEAVAAAVGAALSRLFGRLEKGDHDGFLGDIARCSVDDRRQLSAWFRGYQRGLDSIEWVVEALGLDGEHLTAQVAVVLRFAGYDPVSEVFKFWLSKSEDGCHFLGFEQTRRWGVCDATGAPAGGGVSAPEPLSWPAVDPAEFDSELAALAEAASLVPDPEPAESYARSVSASMRTVEASLERKMAHLVANMMSATTATVAASVRRSTPGETALNLHRLIAGMSPGFPPEIHGETAGHSLPWILSDEMGAFAVARGRPWSGTCQSLAELVTSVLRLSGAGVDQAFTVELYLHNAALFLERPSLMFSNLALIPCSSRTMHWNRSVGAFWNDAMGWDHEGEIVRPEGVAAARRAMAAHAPFLDASSSEGAPVDESGGSVDSLGVLPVTGPGERGRDRSPAETSLEVKRRVFALARPGDHSPWVHARYALQTILVRRPEAYVIRSMAAAPLRRAVDLYPTADDLIEAIGPELRPVSIFPEYHRLMTADQVFRHRMADEKAWALLLASFGQGTGQSSAMVWTDEGWFVMSVAREKTPRVYRMALPCPKRVPAVTGAVRLIAWATGSVYPRLGAWSGDAPASAERWAGGFSAGAWKEAVSATGLIT